MQVEKSTVWQEGFLEKVDDQHGWDSWTMYKRSYDLAKLHVIEDFKGLQSLKFLPIFSRFRTKLKWLNVLLKR